jgi:signal transduction histidine kinase
MLEVSADGHSIALTSGATLGPGTSRIQFRYTGIYLSAPERVQYSYKLEEVDHDWVPVGSRRVIDYSGLPNGKYRFLVRAGLPNGKFSESEFAFRILPYFFETRWFFLLSLTALAALIYGIHLLRLTHIRSQFALVSAERARMAREIHDTLAQGFVGISTQLDAVALKWEADIGRARQHLTLARRMARHSLTEARRSVLDLRASELEEQNLAGALTMAAQRCVAGSGAQVELDIAQIPWKLTSDLEQNLLRILQEAVTNAVKHSKARLIHVTLCGEGSFLWLRISDDGEGFEPSRAYSVVDGHFGILGMRERAERLGGEFALMSTPGRGTRLEVRIPQHAGKVA